MSQIQTRRPDGAAAPGLSVAICSGQDQPFDVFIFHVKTDNAGNQTWPIPAWNKNQWYTLHVNVIDHNPAYAVPPPINVPPADAHGDYPDIAIVVELTGETAPAPPAQGFGRLHLEGQELKGEDGRSVFLRGADAFCAFEVFLRFGPDPLRPVFAELRDRYRVNCLRWWAMSVNLQHNEFNRPPFDPRTLPDYFRALPDFLDFVAEYRFWSYVGLFPDVQIISGDLGWQQDFWAEARTHLEPRASVFGVEFQNEAGAHSFNRLTTGFNPRSPSIPWVGTSYSDADPAYASGTFPADDLGGGPMGDLHPSRRYPAQIMDSAPANNVYFKNNRAVIIGEGDRLGWRGNPNRRQANLIANAARAGAIGAIFHSMHGERCELLTGDSQTSAEGYFEAFGAI